VRFPGAQDRQVFQDIARDITAVDKTRQRLQKTLSSLNRAVCGTFRTLALALEQRDPYTAGHQERVAQLAKAIALRLGLGSKRIQGLYFAGLVHDIGKISIPAAILAKPSDLLEAEFALIREHPRIGWEILKNTEFPWPVAEVVLEHHERLNGSGYPQGLMGEEIRLEARILAVADVVEAMSSHRPYRAGHGLEAALREIEVNKGILFDVQVAEACLDLFREERFSFEHLEYWAASIKDLER
jgi:HD-GYP domain-containing protein (c-di-GMP phosphodiesterase class II)